MPMTASLAGPAEDEFGCKISQLFFFLIVLFIYIFLAVLGLHCCLGFSLLVTSGSYSSVAVCGLLIVVASLAAEYEL